MSPNTQKTTNSKMNLPPQSSRFDVSKTEMLKRFKNFSKSIKYSFIGLILLSLLLAFFIVYKAIQQAPAAKIEVSPNGLTALQYQQLNEVMQSQSLGSYFSANLPNISEKAQSFSWIEEVNVNRDWTRGIVIEALPRQPIARFGSERLIDSKGDVYVPADNDRLSDNELVTLQGDPEQSDVIMQQMQQVNEAFEPLGLTVEDIILTPRMTWLIRFDSGLRLLVDGENTAQKLLNVSQVLQNQLANKRETIESIDSRYKNGFAISWKES